MIAFHRRVIAQSASLPRTKGSIACLVTSGLCIFAAILICMLAAVGVAHPIMSISAFAFLGNAYAMFLNSVTLQLNADTRRTINGVRR